MYIKKAFSLIIILHCFITFSQNYKFEHLSTEDGLSQNDVNSIYQDKEGFMWFGTHDGLNKFDGYNFTTYVPESNNPTSINSNLIWDIVGDKNDNLWIGTTGHGLNFLNKNTEEFQHFVHEPKKENSISSNIINSLFIDSGNKLWIGTPNGVDVVDLNKPIDSINFQHFQIKITKSSVNKRLVIKSFFEDSNNTIWIGSSQGLFKVIDSNKNFVLEKLDIKLDLFSSTINSIIEDRFHNLLIGTQNGFFSYPLNKKNREFRLVNSSSVTEMILDGSNNIWVGTTTGFLKFSNSRKYSIPKLENKFSHNLKNESSLSQNVIKSVFIDKTGIIWIGTNGGGINILNTEKKQFKNIKSGPDKGNLSESKIRSIFEDSNGNLWIGTQSSGLNLLLKSKDSENFNNFKNFKSLSRSFTIAEIKEGDRKKVLIGLSSGKKLVEVDITDPQKNISEYDFKKVEGVPIGIFSILQDSKNNLWLGSYNDGIQRILNNSKKDILKNIVDEPLSLPNNIIRDILEDKKGNIWFATGGGLSKLKPNEIEKDNPKFETYKNIPKDSTSISFNYILDIFESKNGTLWIGTLGGGLNKYIPSKNNIKGTFKRYSTKQGLPSNAIKGILEDDNSNLWISTNRGISKFNPEKETFKNYDINDGLQSNEYSEIACFKLKNGDLIYGGVNGFTIFSPNKIKNNKHKTETAITRFSIFNKPIEVNEKFNGRVLLDKTINRKKELELKYNENSFSFEFTSLHFAAPGKNEYAYKLDGFDQNWNYTNSSRRFANYTNISPGTYTLKVKASNNDGLWDKTPAKLKITITPPFWATNLAKAIYALLILGLLIAFRKFTVISTSKKYDLELEHLEKEKYEEINRLKLEFFTNISHELRTPLTLIKGPIDYLKSKGQKLQIKDTIEQLGIMEKNANYLLRLVNQLLDFRKMEKGKMKLVIGENNIVDFIKEVCEPFQFLSHKKQINFKISSKQKTILTWFDGSALEKIVNNLLSNAFKFTPNNGKISIEIIKGEDFETLEQVTFPFDKSECVVIKIKDSGPGIPEHRIKHIFERYYTEIDKNKISEKGTGIGLSFVKNLVELHKGAISVISDFKNGSTFFVCLPINKVYYENCEVSDIQEVSKDNSFLSALEQESQAIGVIDDLVDKNISKSRSKLPVLLVVDDNKDIRALIKKSFGEDFHIYEAENGEQGFEMALKYIPNIIITDLMMPIMDGVELCNKLKTTNDTSHIPLVMLTAASSKEKEIEGLKTGADIYIKKPFEIEVLKLKLNNILSTRELLRKRFNREVNIEPGTIEVESNETKFLLQATEIVEKHMMDTNFSVELLVKELSISRSGLYLKIKELTDLSCSEFIRSVRLKRAVQLLEQSDLSVKEIMYMTGFNTASYFSKCFKNQYGILPSKYIRDKSSKN